MDSEPKDHSNPFQNEDIIETVIEEDTSRGYKKVLKQHILKQNWPDYQEETFAGPPMDWRALSLENGEIRGVRLRRIENDTEICFGAVGRFKGFGLFFQLVLPDNKREMIMEGLFDTAGKILHMNAHALPRSSFDTRKQTQENNPDRADRLENPTVDTGRKTLYVEDWAGNLAEYKPDALSFDVALGNFSSTGFTFHSLSSTGEPISILYDQHFVLFERDFQLEKSSGLYILHQRLLTPPFPDRTTTFSDAISPKKIKKQLTGKGSEWRNFFDDNRIKAELKR